MTWSNWAGNVTATPVRVERCRSTDDVVAAVQAAVRAGLTVKPIGAGHSFTSVGATQGVQLDLTGLSGILAREGSTVTVGAGTKLDALNGLLGAQGLAMANLGDIDVQTISGAISTGTHGTGRRLPGFAGLVSGLQLVTASGAVVDASRDVNEDLFHAARVGLGAFGVITQVQLECVPAFRAEAVEEPMAVTDVRRDLDELVDGNDHFEFFWFPYSDAVLTKRNRRLEPGDDSGRPLSRLRYRLEDELLSNTVFEACCRVAHLAPGIVRSLNRVSAKALGARTYTDHSYSVFASPRAVRFVESEYAVPRAAVLDVIAELSAWLNRTTDFVTPFPIEVRFAAPDDAWLSTGYERENAYIAIHQYHRMSEQPYFSAFEAIVAAYDGRPHWGKMHSLDAERLAELYPRFESALRVRDRLDPERVFQNEYLERVLG